MEVDPASVNLSISRMDIFNMWQENDDTDAIYANIVRQFSLENMIESSEEMLKSALAVTLSKMKNKWHSSSRNRNFFFSKYGKWLNGMLMMQCTTYKTPSNSVPNPVGPPLKNFEDCCSRTKKNKVMDLLNKRSSEELVFAAATAVRSSGKKDAANIIAEVASSPAEVATKLKKLNMKKVEPRPLSADEALAFYIDCKLSKKTYNIARERALNAGHKMYPSYYKLAKAKADCYPSDADGSISVSETRVDIKLQSLLELTVKRLVFSHAEVFEKTNGSQFQLICKWGGDGSSGHSRYKQRFENITENDEFLLAFSFVPLKLHELENENNVAWYNPVPSSTRYCRPLLLLFSKETADVTRRETQKIQSEIDTLIPTKIIIKNKEITVHYKFMLTMVDGKVCSALTEEKSSQTCYICGATPKLMNNITALLSLNVNENNYRFGLSTLHMWIRLFECFLNISYRLNIKKWAVRSEVDKNEITRRKLEIQNKFKEEMGLIVDRPKPGFGSTNDGNSARRFFKNYILSSTITGLNEDLLHKFYILLSTITSGYDIDVDKFQDFIAETRELYLSLYPWYNMPVTMHKLLSHGPDVIKYCILPIGMLSEEAQEARNKDLRGFREHCTRKCSRLSTNKDLVNMLLLTSDPLINTFRDTPRKSRRSLPTGVLQLLKTPDVDDFIQMDNSEDESNMESNPSDLDDSE